MSLLPILNYNKLLREKLKLLFMKKFTVFLSIMMLAIQALFAQLPQKPHWTVNPYQFPTNMVSNSAIYIDNVDVQNPYYELGAFCGDEVRGAALSSVFPPTGKYVWLLMIYGNDGDQITFKVYDHQNKQELDLVCHTTVTYHSNDVLGSAPVPYHVEFVNATPATYTLTVNYSGAGEQTPQQHIEQLYAGDPYSIVSPVIDCYTANPSVVEGLMPDEDLTVDVVYTLNSHVLTINYKDSIGHTIMNSYSDEYGCGEYYYFESPSIMCYTTNQTVLEGTMPDEDLTFDVVYTLNSHTLTINYNAIGGQTLQDSYVGVVNCDEAYYVPTPEVPGYIPDIFIVEGTMPDSDVTITVTYSTTQFEITAEADPEYGGIVTGAGTYAAGSEVTLTAIPETGYDFINWTYDGEEVSTNASYTFVVDEPKMFVAHFEIRSCVVTVAANPDEGGTVEGGGTFIYGQTATLTASANETFNFVNWTINGEPASSETIYSFEVTDNVDVIANFQMTQYEISVTANPENGGTITGNGSYVINSEATITATPNEGFVFVNWTENDEVVSEETSYTFTVETSRTFVANFAHNQTISLNQGDNYFSTYIEMDGTAGLDMLKEALGEDATQIRSQDGNFIQYIKDYGWYGELSTIQNDKMYVVTMKNAATITLVGNVVDPDDVTITIHKGANYIGYPSTNENQSVASALADLTPAANDMIKSESAFAMYRNGSWIGQLHALNPGKGYIYNSKAEGTKTFKYPNNDSKEKAYNEETHWTPVTYGESAMYVLGVLKINDKEYSSDAKYEIGAFVDGECRGAGIAEDFGDGYFIYMLQVNGDHNGDEVYFDIYDRDDMVECDLVCMETIEFEINGYIGFDECYYPINFVDGAMITVSANPLEGGTVDGGGRYTTDTEVTLSATANTNYTFQNWTENGAQVSENATFSFNASTRRNIVANFHHDGSNYNIEIMSIGNGTIQTYPESAAANETVTVIGTPNQYFRLYGLTVYRTSNPSQEIEVINNQFTMPDFDVTVTGVFMPDNTDYLVAIDPTHVNGTLSAPSSSKCNTTVNVTVTPDTNGFLEVLTYIDDTGDHNITETKSFTMPQSDVTLHATFGLRGDSDANDFVNILDVVNTARKVLGENPISFNTTRADFNQDNVIDVNDITGTANFAVTRGVAECYDYQGAYYIEDGMLNIETDIEVAGIQVELDAETATFINLEGFTMGAAWVNGKYVMLAYSLDKAIEVGTHKIMQLGRVNIKRIVVSTAEGCNVNMCNGHLNVTENEDTDIQIYPNPANNYIRIDGSNIEKVTVTNVIGQVVIEREIHSDNGVIDLGKLLDGTYLFRIMTPEGVFTKNVIIAK